MSEREAKWSDTCDNRDRMKERIFKVLMVAVLMVLIVGVHANIGPFVRIKSEVVGFIVKILGGEQWHSMMK